MLRTWEIFWIGVVTTIIGWLLTLLGLLAPLAE
jgi:hypothetical protein